MLDDPTSSLDNKVSDTIFEGIRSDSQWRDRTFIVATKKVGALKHFDRVIFMANGSIIFQGSFDELKEIKEFEEFLKIANSNKEGEKSMDEINQELDKELTKNPEGDLEVSQNLIKKSNS